MEEEGAEPGDVEELTRGPTASRGGARAPKPASSPASLGPASWGPALGQPPSPHTLSCPAFSEDLVRLGGGERPTSPLLPMHHTQDGEQSRGSGSKMPQGRARLSVGGATCSSAVLFSNRVNCMGGW